MFMATSRNLVFISGTSKGLGKALLEKYLNEGDFVFHISRSPSTSQHANQKHFQYSVSDWEHIEPILQEFYHFSQTEQFKEILLINNAGKLGEAKALHHIPIKDIVDTINVNLTSAMAWISLFLEKFSESEYPLSIINISSGAAKSSIHGWSVYSASKAGLDRMTQTVALETSTRKARTQVYSIYPGVIDTDMQAEIRDSKLVDFPNRENFILLKTKGNLSTAQDVANKIHYLAHSIRPTSGSILDVRDIDLG
jgi:benzil reductase ((S)-benzoin forming)